MQPENGFLAGTIIDVKLDTLTLKDFNQKQWQIQYHNIFIPPLLELTEGEQIKIKGKLTGFTIDTELGLGNTVEMNFCTLDKQ